MNIRAMAVAFVLAAACATDEGTVQGPDADLGGGSGMDGGGNGMDGAVSMLPAWMLEDVQPQSPRAGQTYGLAAFTDHTVVVVLLEGH